jgi:hypothetical protein
VSVPANALTYSHDGKHVFAARGTQVTRYDVAVLERLFAPAKQP